MVFKGEHLYFIAIVPPDDVSGRITGLKKHMSEKYGSKHALRSPPHVTLHMPFRWKESKWARLHEALTNLAACCEPFTINLDGFGAFEPRVIFVEVEPSLPLTACFEQTRQTMRSLNVLNANYKDTAYHAHITIGFRDLKKAKFYQAWKEFQAEKFSATFQVSSLALLQQKQTTTNKPCWEVFQQYKMRG